MSEEDFWLMMKFLASHIPEMAILLLGTMLAIRNWPRYQRPALVSFLGFGILLASKLAFWSLIFLRDVVYDVDRMMVAFAIRSGVDAVAYGLLIWAVYASRRPVALPPSEGQKQPDRLY